MPITSPVWFPVHLHKCLPIEWGGKWELPFFSWFDLFAIALTEVCIKLLLCRSVLHVWWPATNILLAFCTAGSIALNVARIHAEEDDPSHCRKHKHMFLLGTAPAAWRRVEVTSQKYLLNQISCGLFTGKYFTYVKSIGLDAFIPKTVDINHDWKIGGTRGLFRLLGTGLECGVWKLNWSSVTYAVTLILLCSLDVIFLHVCRFLS